jgi:hypothetical protein
MLSPHAGRGEHVQHRSRDANAPEFCLVIARSKATKQSSGAMNARFVDLSSDTAQLDCFASLAMTTAFGRSFAHFTHPLNQATGKKLARGAFGGSGVRRRRFQNLPPRLPLQLPWYFPHPALEAELRIAAAAPRFAARPQRTQPPELEHVAIVPPQRRLLSAEPRRIFLGGLLLRRVFVHGVPDSSSCPAKRGRGTALRNSVVEGASAAPLAQSPHAPSTARVRGPPPPLRFTTRGRISERIPATQMRPSLASSLRGAIATKQSSGAMNASFVVLHNETAALDCFAELVIGPATSGRTRWLAMTKGKKEAERRQTCSANLRAPTFILPPLAGEDTGGGAARALVSFSSPRAGRVREGHARLSAFHHGSYRQGSRPLGATPGQASWDVAGRSIRYGRPNRGAKISRSDAGVTRARLSQSRECTSRTGHSAGQHDARSCPGAECIVPPAGTALAPPLGIPSRQASLASEIRRWSCN